MNTLKTLKEIHKIADEVVEWKAVEEIKIITEKAIAEIEKENQKIEFTRVNNCVNGNPRYVCHFLNIADDYGQAVKLANSIGGRKHHTKNYGGGIIFSSYNIQDLETRIKALKTN